MKNAALKISWILILALVAGMVSGQTMTIDIMATSDVHNYYLDYDYFTDMPTVQNGLVRIATAMKEIRAKNPNTLYFDNGDFIQGNPLGEYLSKNPPVAGEISPIMALLNALKADAVTTGNHEYNFGLDYLNKVISGAAFPVLTANVVHALSKAPYFRPYTILRRNFVDDNGKLQTIRIGVLGLTPPQITTWDGAHLKNKVLTLDGYLAAQIYVPMMKANGADLIVILGHTGIVDYPWKGMEENFGYFLTQIPGVDAVITGHVHQKFPSKAYAATTGADIDKGTINGIPVVMPNSFADTLGVITLKVQKEKETWKRVDGGSRLVPIYDAASRRPLYEADKELSDLLSKEHEAVLAYIRSPVGADEGGDTAGGSLTAPLTSFFAVIRDDYSVQIINEAQTRYAQQALAGTEYEKLPILSAAAPFKAGGRQGPRYYTNVPTGPLAIKNIADLYVYPNTVVLLKLSGAGVKEWLEMSAGQFNQLNSDSAEQYIQDNDFPTYLFDVIDGVTYKIDTTRPARYNRDGSVNNAGAERIKDLRFNGQPIKLDQEFVLVTNNYRAYGGGNFPGGNPGNIILESPDESRQVILRYIAEKKTITPEPNNNWSLILPTGSGPLLFLSSPDAKDNLPPGISYYSAAETGFAVYQVQP